MRVIVYTETSFCSGTRTHVYVPETGGEYATDKQIRKAIRRLYQSDLDMYGDQVDKSDFDEDALSAYVYAGGDTITYETVEIKSA